MGVSKRTTSDATRSPDLPGRVRVVRLFDAGRGSVQPSTPGTSPRGPGRLSICDAPQSVVAVRARDLLPQPDERRADGRPGLASGAAQGAFHRLDGRPGDGRRALGQCTDDVREDRCEPFPEQDQVGTRVRRARGDVVAGLRQATPERDDEASPRVFERLRHPCGIVVRLPQSSVGGLLGCESDGQRGLLQSVSDSVDDGREIGLAATSHGRARAFDRAPRDGRHGPFESSRALESGVGGFHDAPRDFSTDVLPDLDGPGDPRAQR